MAEGNKMREMSVNKLMVQMGIPMILSMALQAVYNIVDSAFVGNMRRGSEAALNALTLVFPVQMLMVAVGIGTGVGTNALLARTLGQGNEKKAAKVAGNSLFLGIIIYAICLLFGIFGVKAYISSQTVDPEVVSMGTSYLRICCIISFGIIFFSLFEKLLQATGRSLYSTIGQVVGAVVNIILDPIMIYGIGPVPEMGVEGAAIATFISQAVGGVLPVFYFLNRNNTSRIHLCRPRFEGKVLLNACINGSSELMTNLSMSLVNILYNYQLLRFAGEDGVAAYGVIMYASFLFVAVFVGYAVGSAPIVSYHYGANNRKEVNNLYRKSLKLIGVVAVGMTIGSMFIIPHVARFFVGYDENLLILTTRAFRLYGLSFLIMGFNVYASSFFTALGDGVTSALISFLRTLLFQVAAARSCTIGVRAKIRDIRSRRPRCQEWFGKPCFGRRGSHPCRLQSKTDCSPHASASAASAAYCCRQAASSRPQRSRVRQRTVRYIRNP